MKITSLQNEKVKYWASLKEKKNRDKDCCFLVEGDHLVDEAQRLNLTIETISTDDVGADYLVSKEVMKKISDQKSICSIASVVRFIPENKISGNVLILDGIQDPGNLGTIIRSAVAFNFYTIILGDDCVDLYNPKVVRSTEGMIFNVNVWRRNLKEFIPSLKEMGYIIVGTDVEKGKNIKELEKKTLALVIGSEGRGVSSDIKKLCDEFVYIRMNEECESLNAGVASSILMYEVNNG